MPKLATELFYLLAAVLFIIGIKMLGSARTARNGNLFSGAGMLLAVIVTLLHKEIIDYTYIIAGLVIGSAIGAILAKKVEMTAMPQMVGLLNGFGGAGSMLVGFAEYLRLSGDVNLTVWTNTDVSLAVLITLALSLLIGAVTFWGSLVAFLKLQGWMKSAPVLFSFQKQLNAAILATIIVLGALFVLDPSAWLLLLVIILLSSILGVTSVIPIGGADMPVVVSLLNSYSGMAAAATGFVLSNSVLVIAGTLVGTSGLILTQIMCRAMNRSLANVLFAGVGAEIIAVGGAAVEERRVTNYTPEDALMILENAQSVIIIPGYGLAVAQAQHALQDLATRLIEKGVTVRYAIHPVAGRMPGHMNVLLAEANVPYESLLEMDQINDDFPETDVAFVVGANDVVNPAARTKKESPLYGMPILNADQARTVMVLKRSLKPGFAGEDNDLFYDRKTMMIFGDAKATLTNLVHLMKVSSS